jgi:low affinity Fe/Cu permease
MGSPVTSHHNPIDVWHELGRPCSPQIQRGVSFAGIPCQENVMTKNKIGILELAAKYAAAWTGSSVALLLAFMTILIWGITGPYFGYSDTWQLVINTGTTIVTFLMVFLIQRSQNKDTLAVQLKLNEIVAAIEGASNRLINIEDVAEADIQVLQKHYGKLNKLAKQEESLTNSHSIEEAHARHKQKKKTNE